MANNDRTSSGEYRCTVHAYSQSQLDIYIKKAGMDLSFNNGPLNRLLLGGELLLVIINHCCLRTPALLRENLKWAVELYR